MEVILSAILGFALLAAVAAGGAVLLARWLKIDAVSAAVVSTIIVLALCALYFGIAMNLGAA
jgi:hypothetical protein